MRANPFSLKIIFKVSILVAIAFTQTIIKVVLIWGDYPAGQDVCFFVFIFFSSYHKIQWRNPIGLLLK